MPPWHLDKTVGIQHFQNDMSLSDDQISTIARWVDGGAPLGNLKDMPPPKQWPNDSGWQLEKQYGKPDLIIKSEPYTVAAAKGQDVWYPSVVGNSVDRTPLGTGGRNTARHRCGKAGYCITPLHTSSKRSQSTSSGVAMQGVLMEWAINKNYDTYRPGTGKLLLPGAQISWELHYHAVGEEIRDHVELAIYLYPKGVTPKYRTYLTLFPGTPGGAAGQLDIPPNQIVETEGYTVLKAPARLENFQPHMHLRGKAMLLEAILPDGTKANAQLRGPLQL